MVRWKYHVDEAIIYTGLELDSPDNKSEADAEPGAAHAATEEKQSGAGDEEPGIMDVYNEMSDDQKEVVHTMVGAAIEQSTATPDNNSETDTSSSEEKVVTHEQKDEKDMGNKRLREERRLCTRRSTCSRMMRCRALPRTPCSAVR
jgi:hypothetical protein